MAKPTVRNLPDNGHRALPVRAAQHGRSTEVEVREMLNEGVKPRRRLRALLAELDRIPERHNADAPLQWDEQGLPK